MYSFLLVLVYICFISLGLPDSLLGSAWPVMQIEFDVPVSYAGTISMIIFIGTVISSFVSDKMVRKMGIGKITGISVLMTASALFGFSVSGQIWMLMLWALPYGFGAGGVDAVLNNYAALHFKLQHVSWLHCMWGVGALISPYIMSYSLIHLDGWKQGYFIVSVIQFVLAIFILLNLSIWDKASKLDGSEKNIEIESQTLSLKEILTLPGAIPYFITFFSYCALELTTSLWACTYLVRDRGIAPEIASGYASLFYIGLTIGRGVNGFLAIKRSGKTLMQFGFGAIFAGVLLVLLPFHFSFAALGFAIIGVGCGPLFPCIVYMTPVLFGRDKSQAMMGVQLAFANCGFCFMPMLFGLIANYITVSYLPIYLMLLLIMMIVMQEVTVRKSSKCVLGNVNKEEKYLQFKEDD